jgi:hypothetical protein
LKIIKIKSKMDTEHTVLADSYGQNLKGLKPRLNAFSAKDGEDFRHFKKLLENYFLLTNVNNDDRKFIILSSLLYGEAESFMEDWVETSDPVTYQGAMDALEKQYVTSELIQSYEFAYNDMAQEIDEKPQTFYSRLKTAAKLAQNPDPNVLLTRFRTGLLPPIRSHCLAFGATRLEEWKKHAEDWWMAYRSGNMEKNQTGTKNNVQKKLKSMDFACSVPMAQPSSLNVMDMSGHDDEEWSQGNFMEQLAKMVADQINQNTTGNTTEDKKSKKASKPQEMNDTEELRETIRQVVRQEMNQGQGYTQNRYRGNNYNRNYDQNNHNRNYDQNNGYRQNDYRRQQDYRPRENNYRSQNNDFQTPTQQNQQPAKN